MTTPTTPTTGPEIPPVVRTDDARFENLPGFPFEPHYVDVRNPHVTATAGAAGTAEGTPGDARDGTLRMHYVDEGPRDAPVVLMAHGEPTWCYLYRKMIPVFAEAGLRAIAIDNIGFGRSDKLTLAAHYSFENHIEWMRELVVTIDLRNVTIVCQDWGGPISMGVLAREVDRFSRVVAGNTILHTAEAELAGQLAWAAHASSDEDSTVNTMLLDWMHYSHRAIDFDASSSMTGSTVREIAPEVVAAYDAPFPSEWHKAGMRQFPVLIPVTRSDPGSAINLETWRVLSKFDRPFLTLFGDSDPPTRGWEKIFQARVPGAKGQPHRIQERAGHFWQEDNGPEAARIIVDWIAATS